MAATFRSVNQDAGLNTTNSHAAIMTPSPATPRPNTAPEADPTRNSDDASTPTRATFTSSAAGQKPLPKDAFPQAVQIPEAAEKSKRKTESPRETPSSRARDSMEMDIDESDGEGGDDDASSDDESVDADGTRSSKKKKSQRFYCTEFPPCSLSFTRSEHLARHIRYVALLGASISDLSRTDVRQETYWRTSFPMPLLKKILST